MPEGMELSRTGDYPRISFYVPYNLTAFDRLLKESSLSDLKETVRTKLDLKSGSMVKLAQIRLGLLIDLEDEADFEAFCSFAYEQRVADVRVTLANHIAEEPARALDEHPIKKRKIEAQTKPGQKSEPQVGHNLVSRGGLIFRDSTQRLSTAETKTNLETAIKPFDEYITCLAEGKLDVYLDSFLKKDKKTKLKVHLPTDPCLLLHGLGKHHDPDHQPEQIKHLFTSCTTHLFAVSGSGKTRLILEGLCQHWGLYISCRSVGPASGSADFTIATEMLQSMGTWDRGDISCDSDAAERVFTMLLCARIFVLDKILQKVPSGTDASAARRRWALAQILPPRVTAEGNDLFVNVLKSLRNADTKTMERLTYATLDKLFGKHRKIFFVAIDEAQVAAHQLTHFRSSDGKSLRPILHEVHKYFFHIDVIKGIILSGTGLSMDMVTNAVGSLSAKQIDPKRKSRVFTDIGCFTNDESHKAYIGQYLDLSTSHSDKRLLERILYWFAGRHRFTASLIEIFLYEESVSKHRILSAFVKQLTGFTITDAVDLEESEPPISPTLVEKIEKYEWVISTADRIFNENNGNLKDSDLPRRLVNVLMRWRIGSQPTSLPIENYMHEMIELGVGFLNKAMPKRAGNFDPSLNHPVFISEPLVVLSLSSLFQEQSQTTRKTWISNSLSASPNSSSLGFRFDEVVLLILLDTFGGKSRPLANAFHCDPSLGSRKVTLVSLRRHTVDDDIQTCPVSWDAGSSDCLGFKAEDPQDVLNFLRNPNGKTFLFPDNHMGPDLLCFLQDEVSGELIVLVVQTKVSRQLKAEQWRSAVESVTPELFYTMTGKKRYAHVSYPNLVKDVQSAFEKMLGPGVYTTEFKKACRRQLRARRSIVADHQSSLTTRQTPRFVRVIATLDEEQKRRLKEGNDDMGILRWHTIRNYLGSIADILKTRPSSVLTSTS